MAKNGGVAEIVTMATAQHVISSRGGKAWAESVAMPASVKQQQAQR